VDSNVIAARTLTSGLTSKAKKVEPVLWRYEFPNILATAIKAKQITREHALGVWKRVAAILGENESEAYPPKDIDSVAQYGITAYDGQFIFLAMEMGIPCITEDQELQEKFRGIALSMDDFLEPPTPGTMRERKARYRGRVRRSSADFPRHVFIPLIG
jgi:predicted nucleic acid-binding protein